MTWFSDMPAWLAALLEASAYGTVLVAAFFLLQPLLRRHLPARWRYALWLIVLVRFLPLPLPASLIHLSSRARPVAQARGHDWDPQAVAGRAAPSPQASVTAASVEKPVTKVATASSLSPVAGTPLIEKSTDNVSFASGATPSRFGSAAFWATAIYVLGAAAVLVRLLASMLLLQRIVKRATRVQDADLVQLLDAARGAQRAPTLLVTDDLSSPAVVGVLRPKLLLPRKLLTVLSREQLRQVLLHELAHVRRHDVLVNYGLALLNVVHWFNPGLWLSLAAVRAERELACDEAAMARTTPAAYGNTLLTLLEHAQPVRTLTPAVGILETRTFMARRIRMIADYRSRRALLAWPALGLVGTALVLSGPISRGQFTEFPALPGDSEVEFSSPLTATTPVGDVTFHGKFGVETQYVGTKKLPPHEFVDISFDLLILWSWDGSVNPKGSDQKPIDIGPDFFTLGIHDGPTLLYTTFSNTPDDPPGFRWESKSQQYPSQVPGDSFKPWTGADKKNTLGYVYPHGGPPKPVPQDAIYKIHFVVPHKAERLTLEMAAMNLQDLGDENWGVANVTIKALDVKDVKRPTEKEIAAAFDASLDRTTKDLPGQFQVLINGMDDTVDWVQKNVKPMPVDSTKLSVMLDALQSGDERVEPELSTQVALLSMGHSIEPALRDLRKTLTPDRRVQLDWALSVLDVRKPSDNAAVLDWLTAPAGAGIPNETMRRLVLATRVLEIIGTDKARALRSKLTLASPKDMAAARPAAAMAAHPGAMADDHFAAKVQELLGVPDKGVDVIPALAEAELKVLENGGDTAIQGVLRPATRLTTAPATAPATWVTTAPAAFVPPEAEAALDKLAAALVQGPHPTAFVEKFLPRVEIGTERGGQSDIPAFDVDQHLDRLSADLWGRAMMVEKTDAKKAAELARASIMLGVLSDYDMNWTSILNRFTDGSKYAENKRLLNLPEGKFEEIAKLVAARFEMDGTTGSMNAGMATDVISGEKDTPVNMELVAKVLQEYDRAFRHGVPQLGMRYRTIDPVWRFLNLMQARKSADGEAATRKVLETWKKDFPDPDLARWIDQALTRSGPVPRTMVGFMMNGKMMTAEDYLKSTSGTDSANPTMTFLKGLLAPTRPATNPASQPATRP